MTKWKEMAELQKELKQIAKKYNVTIVASQQNRPDYVPEPITPHSIIVYDYMDLLEAKKSVREGK